MGVMQRAYASNYDLCSSCCEGLALGAPNAWTRRLLDVLKRVDSENALNHRTKTFARHMGVIQRRCASNYDLCSSCYEGLALVALNAWTHRLLDVLKRVGSENALNHWTNFVCWPYGSEAAWSCVQLRPMLILLRGTGSSRAQCLDTPPA